MQLNCETILDLYTHENTKILCQIKFNVTNGQLQNCQNRWLSQEDWKVFDQELEKLITTIDEWSCEKCLKFVIKPYIHVLVRKSKLRYEHFYKFFNAINGCDAGDDEDVRDSNLVLECLFDLQKDVTLSAFANSEKYDATSLHSTSCSPLSYFPSSSPDRKYDEEYEMCDSVNTPDKGFLEYDKDCSTPVKYSEQILNNSRTTCHSSNSDTTGISIGNNKCSNNDLLNTDTVRTAYEVVPGLEESHSSKDNSEFSRNNFNGVKEEAEEDVLSETDKFRKNSKIKQLCVKSDSTEAKFVRTDKRKKSKQPCKSKGVFAERCYEISPDEFRQKMGKQAQSHGKVMKRQSKDVEMLMEKNVKKSKNKMNNSDAELHNDLNKRNQYAFRNSRGSNRNNGAMREEKEDKINESKNYSKTSLKSPLKQSDYEFEENKGVEKKSLQESNQNTDCSCLPWVTEITRDSPSDGKIISKERHQTTTSLRRSERSPTKPKRFIEYILNSKEPKRYTTSMKNTKIIGTKDDDDTSFESSKNNNRSDKNLLTPVYETSLNKRNIRSSSISSSTRKMNKKDNNRNGCEQEKSDMNKWLSKKKLLPLDKDATKSQKASTKPSLLKALPLNTSNKLSSSKSDEDSERRSKSPIALELPSKEELELIRSKTKLIQTENAKVRAELDKMRTSPPKEVEFLSLQNIPVNDILETFPTYKTDLDEIYETNRKKDYIKGHNGLNHCFVIKLLQQNIQMKMLEKLTDVYSNSKTTTQATLFANALLPEWIIRVYMDKFNFTREQAIDQIKAQEEFQLHMEDQSDNSLMFD